MNYVIASPAKPGVAISYFATMAQLVEQRIRNARVKGSSPFGGSRNILPLHKCSGSFSYVFVNVPNNAEQKGFLLAFFPDLAYRNTNDSL